MNKEKLLKLIKMGESQNLEFTKDAEDVGKTVCSFANTNSGVILVGISDNGKIIGCSDKDEQKVANIAHVCKPSVYPKIEREREWIEGEEVIKIYPKFIPNLSQNRKICPPKEKKMNRVQMKKTKKLNNIILKSFIVIAVVMMLLTITPGEAIQAQNNKHQEKSFPTQDYKVYCRRLYCKCTRKQ